MFAQNHLQGRSIGFVEKLVRLGLGLAFLIAPFSESLADQAEQESGNGEYYTQIYVCLRARDKNLQLIRVTAPMSATVIVKTDDSRSVRVLSPVEKLISTSVDQYKGCERVLNTDKGAKVRGHDLRVNVIVNNKRYQARTDDDEANPGKFTRRNKTTGALFYSLIIDVDNQPKPVAPPAPPESSELPRDPSETTPESAGSIN